MILQGYFIPVTQKNKERFEIGEIIAGSKRGVDYGKDIKDD